MDSTAKILLLIIAALLFLVWIRIGAIETRLKERFPTEKEQDHEWSQRDPMGHSEAHKDPKERP